ncbi:MAG TPA: SPOR domain-containing protein, partial [Thermoanaerobaculia bacterium]|nr:SPOR domain-containing protein [Thermoanaerobaculia bacterium]
MKSKLLLVLLILVIVIAGCAPKTPPRVVARTPPPKTKPAPAPVQPAPAKPVQPVPRQPAPQETPAEAPYDEKEPLLVKVGLASDLETVTFPCCEEPLQVFVETQEVTAGASLKIEPAAASSQKGFYRLQVAALRDERQAQDLARRLEKESGQPGEAYFDAGIDLYRIRVGHYPTREAAEADLKHLSTMGVTGGFIVNEGG